MARIRTIKPESAEAAEFRGLFFSEGHLDLVRQGKTTRGLVSRARIALREDDLAVLVWVQEFLGGWLSHRKATRSWCWHLTGLIAMRELVALLRGGSMPSKKRAEVELIAEALSYASVRGQHLLDFQVDAQRRIHKSLIEARRCNGAD